MDTATRGALKDDSTFKCIRDVIKKGNKVFEAMLVRRERKYTLFFRLVQYWELKEIGRIRSWNIKVERAVKDVADSKDAGARVRAIVYSDTDAESDSASTVSGISHFSGRSENSGNSSRSASSMFRRGRSMLPSAGKVRARRATPTPRLRNRFAGSETLGQEGAASSALATGAEDGFSAVTSAPVTTGNLAKLQQSLDGEGSRQGALPTNLKSTDSGGVAAQPASQVQRELSMKPKDELVDVIRGLKADKDNRAKDAVTGVYVSFLRLVNLGPLEL